METGSLLLGEGIPFLKEQDALSAYLVYIT